MPSQGVTDNPLHPVSMEIKEYSILQLMFGNILQDAATHTHTLLLLDHNITHLPWCYKFTLIFCVNIQQIL